MHVSGTRYTYLVLYQYLYPEPKWSPPLWAVLSTQVQYYSSCGLSPSLRELGALYYGSTSTRYLYTAILAEHRSMRTYTWCSGSRHSTLLTGYITPTVAYVRVLLVMMITSIVEYSEYTVAWAFLCTVYTVNITQHKYCEIASRGSRFAVNKKLIIVENA